MTIHYNGEQEQTQHGFWRTCSSFYGMNSRHTLPSSATSVASPTTHLRRLGVAHDIQHNYPPTKIECNKIQMQQSHVPAKNTMLKHKLKFVGTRHSDKVQDTYFLLPSWANDTSNYKRCQHLFCRPRGISPTTVRVSNVFDKYSHNSISTSALQCFL